MNVSCEDWTDRLERYLDGDLPPADTARLKGHLRTCPACRLAVEHERLLRRSLAGLPELTLSAERARQMAATPGVEPAGAHRPGPAATLSHSWRRLREQRRRRPAIALGAAACVVALVAAVLWWRPTGPGPDQRPAYSPTEIRLARQQATWSLATAARIVYRAEQTTLTDVLGKQLPRTIRDSLGKVVPFVDPEGGQG